MTDWLRIRNNIINAIFCLAMSIFIVIIVSIIVYQIDLSLAFTSFDVGYTKSELMKEYVHLMNYLINPFADKLKFIYFAASTSGLQHFADVKNLFLIDIMVLIASIVMKIVFKIKLCFYKNDAIMLGMLPIVIGIIASMNFGQFFVWFHELLFSNNDWLFNPLTDPIINVLPEFFFEQLIMLCLIVFEALITIGYLNKKRAKSL